MINSKDNLKCLKSDKLHDSKSNSHNTFSKINNNNNNNRNSNNNINNNNDNNNNNSNN